MPVSPPRQAIDVVHVLHARFGDDLLGVVLYGSFVDGGLRPASDIDLLALLRRRLTRNERAWTMAALLAMSVPPGDARVRALEVTCVVHADIVPWRHPAQRELQFGEWLRAELSAGVVADPVRDPDLALLVAQARARGIALLGPAPVALLPAVPACDIRDAIHAMRHDVARGLAGEETHALLTLARMWVTLASGDIVAKDAAAARVLPHLPLDCHATLERARTTYLGTYAQDWRGREREVAACAAALQAAIGRLC